MDLSTNEYNAVADETLESLTELFEDLPERLQCDLEYDASYGVNRVKSECIGRGGGERVGSKFYHCTLSIELYRNLDVLDI